MDGAQSVEGLCSRLAGVKEVFLPSKQECDKDENPAEEDLAEEARTSVLQNYFQKSPIKFLQRYHTYIKPKEISCFNDLPENDQVAYYIRKICQQQDLESRTQLDREYISQEVKKRRYKALQKLIKEGEYFSEEEMEKRSPELYQYYIGRYLTVKEKEDKLKARAAAHPASLSGFFMDVIERKQDQEEMEAGEEEFDEDSEEEEEEQQQEEGEIEIPDEEKAYLAKEFESRMYQHFLDGLDKNFSYETVDQNAEYDDLAQIEQDVEDNYFDDEEPSGLQTDDSVAMKQEGEEESEDELDKYMRTLQDPKGGDISKAGGENPPNKMTGGDEKELVT